jgi:hypothetical protein
MVLLGLYLCFQNKIGTVLGLITPKLFINYQTNNLNSMHFSKILLVFFSGLFFIANLSSLHASGSGSGSGSEPEANVQTSTKVAAPFKPYKNVKLTFKVKNTNKTVNSFTENDAAKLRNFFVYKPDNYACNSKTLTFLGVSYNNGNAPIEKNLITELNNIGYAVVNLECQNERVVFLITKSGKDMHYAKADAATTQQINEQLDGCSQCGAVKLSDDLINKFKDADFGGQAIDLGSDDMSSYGDDEESINP